MLTREEARTRVANGAAYLDCVHPDWWARIDVRTLRLKDECRCVLAQVCRTTYGVAARALGIQHISPNVWDTTEACDLGFFNEGPGAGWQQLQRAWIEAITDRRRRSGVRADGGRTDIPAARPSAPGHLKDDDREKDCAVV